MSVQPPLQHNFDQIYRQKIHNPGIFLALLF